MKLPLSFTIIALGSSTISAEARPSAKSASQKLNEDLRQYTELFPNSDCVFSSREIASGYLVRIIDETKNVLEIEMTRLESLKFKGKEASDGSFQHIFKTADAAYDQVTISNGQQSLTCEADY